MADTTVTYSLIGVVVVFFLVLKIAKATQPDVSFHSMLYSTVFEVQGQ
jgi:uncharacterized membrane protein